MSCKSDLPKPSFLFDTCNPVQLLTIHTSFAILPSPATLTKGRSTAPFKKFIVEKASTTQIKADDIPWMSGTSATDTMMSMGISQVDAIAALKVNLLVSLSLGKRGHLIQYRQMMATSRKQWIIYSRAD